MDTPEIDRDAPTKMKKDGRRIHTSPYRIYRIFANSSCFGGFVTQNTELYRFLPPLPVALPFFRILSVTALRVKSINQAPY